MEVEIKFSPPLREAVLIRRYKRFLTDVRFPGGQLETVLCPNTGSLKSCNEPGKCVLLSHSPDPGRKYPYTWQMIQMDRSWVGINTSIPNNLVSMAVKYGAIPEFISYPSVQREVRVSEHSRLDLMLEGPPGKCYVEIKNVTLAEGETASFPDAVTERGRKHLDELMKLQKKGHRAVMLFLVQRNDTKIFRPADHIDPEYGKALRRVAAAGVEVLVYQAVVSPDGIRWGDLLPKDLSDAPFVPSSDSSTGSRKSIGLKNKNNHRSKR